MRQYYCNLSHQTFQPGIWIWIWISQELQPTMLKLVLLCDVSQFVRWKIRNNFVKTSLRLDWQLVGRERERGEKIRISRAGGQAWTNSHEERDEQIYHLMDYTQVESWGWDWGWRWREGKGRCTDWTGCTADTAAISPTGDKKWQWDGGGGGGWRDRKYF